MKQIVKIEAPYGVTGTKVLNEHGQPLHPRIYSVRFEQNAGDVPRLRLEVFAMETVIEGEMEVEQVTICPACKKEVPQQAGVQPEGAALIEVTTHSDEAARYVQVQQSPK